MTGLKMKRKTWLFQISLLLTLGCQSDQPAEQSVPSLKDVYQNIFMIGTALNSNQINGNDSNSMALVKKHFNSITAENDLKWKKFTRNRMFIILIYQTSL